MTSSAHRLARLATGFQRYLCMLPVCFHENVIGHDLSTLSNKYCIVLHVVFFSFYLLPWHIPFAPKPKLVMIEFYSPNSRALFVILEHFYPSGQFVQIAQMGLLLPRLDLILPRIPPPNPFFTHDLNNILRWYCIFLQEGKYST